MICSQDNNLVAGDIHVGLYCCGSDSWHATLLSTVQVSSPHKKGRAELNQIAVCLSLAACRKTTVIVAFMFAGYKVAREQGKPYRAVFVTASPTLKQQVADAFSKFQVRMLAVRQAALGVLFA